eukprot:366751-Pyramimonas_sp.AAC.1
MVDKADRWHAARLLEGDSSDAGHRLTERLCHAILSCWTPKLDRSIFPLLMASAAHLEPEPSHSSTDAHR